MEGTKYTCSCDNEEAINTQFETPLMVKVSVDDSNSKILLKNSNNGTAFITYSDIAKSSSNIDLLNSLQAIEPVDMGSAGTWSDCNVGAKKPWEIGQYFAWADVNGYTEDTMYQSKAFELSWYKGLKAASFNSDINKDKTYDASHVNMDNKCVGFLIPDATDFQNLVNSTTKTYEVLHGVPGIRFTSTETQNSIFIPAVGYGEAGTLQDFGNFIYCWTGTYSNNSDCGGFSFDCSSMKENIKDMQRYLGFNIRPKIV